MHVVSVVNCTRQHCWMQLVSPCTMPNSKFSMAGASSSKTGGTFKKINILTAHKQPGAFQTQCMLSLWSIAPDNIGGGKWRELAQCQTQNSAWQALPLAKRVGHSKKSIF